MPYGSQSNPPCVHGLRANIYLHKQKAFLDWMVKNPNFACRIQILRLVTDKIWFFIFRDNHCIVPDFKFMAKRQMLAKVNFGSIFPTTLNHCVGHSQKQHAASSGSPMLHALLRLLDQSRRPHGLVLSSKTAWWISWGRKPPDDSINADPIIWSWEYRQQENFRSPLDNLFCLKWYPWIGAWWEGECH